MTYRAVIFDLDGTLVDSAPALRNIASAFLAELGLAPLTLDEARAFIGDGARRFCERALAARDQHPDNAALDAHYARFREIYAAAPGADNPPYPGAMDALARLHEAGIALGLCTNKPGLPTDNVLDALGLGDTFGVVVTGDTLSTKKPDPEPLRHAIRALGVTVDETLYVGDSEVDWETAQAASCAFALHTAGYLRVAPDTLAPRYRVDRIDEIVALVLDGTGQRAGAL